MENKIKYYLVCYEKIGDDFIYEYYLGPEMGEADIREMFDLSPDEPPGDCLEVEKKHLRWLMPVEAMMTPTTTFPDPDLDSFDYFVEARSD